MYYSKTLIATSSSKFNPTDDIKTSTFDDFSLCFWSDKKKSSTVGVFLFRNLKTQGKLRKSRREVDVFSTYFQIEF